MFNDEMIPEGAELVLIDEPLPVSEQRWLPRTVADAEWAALTLREVNEALNAELAAVDEYVERVQQWAAAAIERNPISRLRHRAAALEAALKAYALEQRAGSPLTKKGEPTIKSVVLPSARIKTYRAGGSRERLEVQDHDALLAWVKAQGLAGFAVRETVIVEALAWRPGYDGAVFTPDGERIPGLVRIPPTPGQLHASVQLVEEGE